MRAPIRLITTCAAFIGVGLLELTALAAPTSAAVPTAGQALAWGQGVFGEIGNGTTPNAQATPVAVKLPKGVTATSLSQSASSDAQYAVGSNGKLYTWGGDEAGQLGNGTGGSSATLACTNGSNPFPCATTPVTVHLPKGVTAKAVTSAALTGFAIGSDNNLYAWGGNGDGQLGDGTFTSTNVPVKVTLPAGVTPVSISTAQFDAYLTTTTGQVYSWGYGSTGQLGTGDQGVTTCGSNSTTCTPTPTALDLPAGTSVTSIAGGAYSTYAIAGGSLYVWGSDEDGTLGGGTTSTYCNSPGNNLPCNPVPQTLPFPGSGSPTNLTSYGFGAFVSSTDGNLYTWGYNVNGSSGNGSASGESVGARVSLPTGFGPGQLGSGYVNGYTTLAAT